MGIKYQNFDGRKSALVLYSWRCKDRITSSQSAHRIVLSKIPLDRSLVLYTFRGWYGLPHIAHFIVQIAQKCSVMTWALLSFSLEAKLTTWVHYIRDKKRLHMKVCITGWRLAGATLKECQYFCPRQQKLVRQTKKWRWRRDSLTKWMNVSTHRSFFFKCNCKSTPFL